MCESGVYLCKRLNEDFDDQFVQLSGINSSVGSTTRNILSAIWNEEARRRTMYSDMQQLGSWKSE